MTSRYSSAVDGTSDVRTVHFSNSNPAWSNSGRSWLTAYVLLPQTWFTESVWKYSSYSRSSFSSAWKNSRYVLEAAVMSPNGAPFLAKRAASAKKGCGLGSHGSRWLLTTASYEPASSPVLVASPTFQSK